MFVPAFVSPSTKSFFSVNDIWHVVRGRWVMHDGMQYDPIQGQGHEPFKVGNPAIFNSCHLQCELATRDFELGRNISRGESTISPARGLIFHSLFIYRYCWYIHAITKAGVVDRSRAFSVRSLVVDGERMVRVSASSFLWHWWLGVKKG